ncbi:hypothetical protein ONZ43_g6300 [Nemania bipapillata]|uniref:Uncharacterized protein n=1 Tax=Nemania bipapillata TaxID=110536 RepID=A0ACC2I0G6_9PEZI|nr:hypothetical protein ONZ43_g6300 [Nemania bipapillata]
MISLPLLLTGAIAPTIISALPSAFPEALVPREYPEFIPAPGFPSLASLNLTTEMLYRAPKLLPIPDEMVSADSVIGPLYTDTCESGFVTANVDDVIACFNYLVALGNTVITVTAADKISGTPYLRQVAISGTAHITAHALADGVKATAYNVALGVQWSFTNCNHGGQVAGSAAAYGNGDLIILTSGYE